MLWQCQLCDKPFSKESSYKRHISYCRRSQARSRVRPRSCLACNAAKVKCTFQTPCRRCLDKGLECVYEVSRRTAVPGRDRGVFSVDTTASAVIEPATTAPNQKGSDMVGSFQTADASQMADLSQTASVGNHDGLAVDLSDAVAPLEDNFRIPDMELDFDIGAFNGHGDSNDPWLSLLPDQQVQRISSPSWMWSPTSIQPRMGTVDQAPWAIWTSSVTVDPTVLTPELNTVLGYTAGELVPSLQLIRSSSAVVQHCTRLIIQGLRGYPMMMLRRETLPPFIHPHWHRHNMPALPDPLSSCMSVAHLYAFRSEETRPFLWRTMQAEDERFLAQRKTMSPEDLLACIQAQMIYMIMRFVDGSQDPPELNQQLVRTYQMLCKRFTSLHDGRFCELDNRMSGVRPTWEEWIYAESRRRTACVFSLICRCISVSTGIEGCDAFAQLDALPLACARTLWEARTRAEWEAEYGAESGGHTFGMLVDAHGRGGEDGGRPDVLDSWNARADGLGQLLGIAASIA